MKEIKAKYQIEDTFKITGRGVIFSGVILEGEISTGNFIEFNFENELLLRKITGVEGFSGKRLMSHTGLMIMCQDETEIETLRSWSPEKTIANIFQG